MLFILEKEIFKYAELLILCLWVLLPYLEVIFIMWNVQSGEQVSVLKGHTYYVASVAFSPDGSQIVSGSDDKTVQVWNVQSGEEVRMLNGHTGYVRSVAFSPDVLQTLYTQYGLVFIFLSSFPFSKASSLQTTDTASLTS